MNRRQIRRAQRRPRLFNWPESPWERGFLWLLGGFGLAIIYRQLTS